ncbi:hypothetical protein KSP39_PZI002952 [Platanthera zijinensis]|uniref:DUF659 domain-containing protein n=1 Tax=Platanthera zijinensis TaxID=2320716 RepID=A0AAP0GDL7_9ASPA
MDQFVHSAAESTKGKDSQQSTIESKYKKKARDDVAMYVGRWAYENGIPFNAICNSSFQQMAHVIGLCGPGMKILTFYELRDKILRGDVEKTKEMLGIFTQTCKLNGCTIMTDAWTDRKGRSVMNIMMHCSSGVTFWLSKNVSSTHDGKFIFDFLDETIDSPESPGEHSILQIVTDSASNNMAAAKLMALKIPTIFLKCCAAHTINLLLQDIGKLKSIKSVISLGRQLSIFIYGHIISLDMFRESTKNLDSHELIRPGVTRFATAILSLESILEKKNQLRGLFTSTKWAATKLVSSAGGKQAAMIVMSARFWANVELAVGIFTPFVRVLKRVDGDTSSMGWLYGDIKKAREEVVVVLDHQENKYLPIWKLIDSRWEKKMSSPLHLAVRWWRLNGADTPYLKTMTMKILSLTTSSCGCERNWSTFEMFNVLLKSKYSETSRDPLTAKNVDSGMVQEWMMNVDPEEDEDEDDDDEVFPGEGLT